MTTIKRSITLVFEPLYTRSYFISRVVNSTEYTPGKHLTKEEVNSLINTGWIVTVKTT